MDKKLSRSLRNNSTSAERKLWPLLKTAQLPGTHFRRQAPIGRYIADFVCMKARLVIEIDGEEHALGRGPARDAARSAWLESQGFTVIRFWNHDALQHTEGVAETILLEALERLAAGANSVAPTLALPTRGRE